MKRDQAGGGGVEKETFPPLIWPSALLEGERAEATKLLRAVPAIECSSGHAVAQQVLDELQGQTLQQHIRQPLAYLRRLIEQVRAGSFVALAAARVADARRRAERQAQERARRGLDDPAAAPSSPTAGRLSAEQRAARMSELAKWSKLLGAAPAHPVIP